MAVTRARDVFLTILCLQGLVTVLGQTTTSRHSAKYCDGEVIDAYCTENRYIKFLAIWYVFIKDVHRPETLEQCHSHFDPQQAVCYHKMSYAHDDAYAQFVENCEWKQKCSPMFANTSILVACQRSPPSPPEYVQLTFQCVANYTSSTIPPASSPSSGHSFRTTSYWSSSLASLSTTPVATPPQSGSGSSLTNLLFSTTTILPSTSPGTNISPSTSPANSNLSPSTSPANSNLSLSTSPANSNLSPSTSPANSNQSPSIPTTNNPSTFSTSKLSTSVSPQPNQSLATLRLSTGATSHPYTTSTTATPNHSRLGSGNSTQVTPLHSTVPAAPTEQTPPAPSTTLSTSTPQPHTNLPPPKSTNASQAHSTTLSSSSTQHTTTLSPSSKSASTVSISSSVPTLSAIIKTSGSTVSRSSTVSVSNLSRWSTTATSSGSTSQNPGSTTTTSRKPSSTTLFTTSPASSTSPSPSSTTKPMTSTTVLATDLTAQSVVVSRSATTLSSSPVTTPTAATTTYSGLHIKVSHQSLVVITVVPSVVAGLLIIALICVVFCLKRKRTPKNRVIYDHRNGTVLYPGNPAGFMSNSVMTNPSFVRECDRQGATTRRTDNLPMRQALSSSTPVYMNSAGHGAYGRGPGALEPFDDDSLKKEPLPQLETDTRQVFSRADDNNEHLVTSDTEPLAEQEFAAL